MSVHQSFSDQALLPPSESKRKFMFALTLGGACFVLMMAVYTFFLAIGCIMPVVSHLPDRIVNLVGVVINNPANLYGLNNLVGMLSLLSITYLNVLLSLQVFKLTGRYL